MWLMPPCDPPIAALGDTNPGGTAFMRYVAARWPARACPVRLAGWTTLPNISPLLIAGVVTVEDPRFFDHRGVDWRSSWQALRLALRARRIVRGASTITQQLARNLYLTPSRQVVRKLREMRLALAIERAIAKPRILELYLNVVELGVDVWGCTAASLHYFQKTPRDLDLFDSTFLVSLLPAPRAALSGPNALRSWGVQIRLAHRLFLSGLASGEACAVCAHRVRRLHPLLAAGVPLPEALARSKDVNIGCDGTVLDELAAHLGVARLDPAELIVMRCGRDQQDVALERARRLFGDDVLLQAARAGDYVRLRVSGSPRPIDPLRCEDADAHSRPSPV
jgi:monofunctional biosynthetic peptidoglycan transglycosylase